MRTLKKIIALGIGAAIIVAIIASLIAFQGNTEPNINNNNLPEFDWRNSGPFFINKEQYKISENIAISIRGLKPNDIGAILFVSPEGKIARIAPFNGTAKSGFNTYWKPDTSTFTGLYEVKQLVGTWTMVFNGTNYEPLHFEIINEFIPGGEAEVKDIQRPESKPIPQKPIGPSLNDTG